MNAAGRKRVVITGLGLVTPFGNKPDEVLRRIQAGDTAAAPPTGFDASAFACSVCAQVKDFEPQRYVSETKMVRLMNRDAQLAVAAAHLALEDAGVKPGTTYPPQEIALFGATGLAGLPLREVAPLVRVSSGMDGEFDLTRFGQAGLKAVSPILSFKILSNMPFCFVSINEGIQGPNAIYTPWEGAGAQAVEAGVRALQAGDACCALVGGCDVKTHELAFVGLQQQGLFECWKGQGAPVGCSTTCGESKDAYTPEKNKHAGKDAGAPGKSKGAGKDAGAPGKSKDAGAPGGPLGVVPGEGAAFLVLEREGDALARGANLYGYLSAFSLGSCCSGDEVARVRTEVLRHLNIRQVERLVSSENGGEPGNGQELSILGAAGISAEATIRPKQHVGDLFAAAALLQVALGAALTRSGAGSVLVNCFGHGGTQAAFVLEKEDTRRRGDALAGESAKPETRRQGCRRSQLLGHTRRQGCRRSQWYSRL